MPESVNVAFTAAVQVQAAAATHGDGQPARSIAGLAVPFGVTSQPESWTGARYQFSGPPGNAGDLLDMVRGHDDDRVIGRLSAAMEQRPDGMHATARVFGTTAGSDALIEATEGVLTGFSISAEIAEYTTDPATDVRHVTAWTARHLGLVRRPAFEQARGLQVAASQREERTMPATTTTTTTPAPPAPAGAPTGGAGTTPTVAEMPTVAELAAQVSPLVAVELEAARAAGRHPLAQFATEADYVHALAAAEGDAANRLRAAFAVPDQVTGDNPGLMAPQWRSVIAMNLDARRPAIRGTGGPIGLPDSGMQANWAYYDGDLDAIIAQQLAEKTDLSGVKISIKTANEPIKTAGTVSDISYQLLLRSSPGYLESYLRICRAAWGRYTEGKYEQALHTRGTPAGDPLVADDASQFGAWLFAQSQAVEDATGAPADVVGVSSDVWLMLGALESLYNPRYGTQNAQGVASAATLRVELNGLTVTRWPFLPDGAAVVTNGQAARFPEYGPMVANAEDVRKLGRDVAVWGMYEDAEVYFPAGVIVGAVAVTP